MSLFYTQTELNEDVHDTKSSAEAICNFKPPKDKLPQTFRLMRVKGLQPWANTSSVSVGDVIQVTIFFPLGASKSFIMDILYFYWQCDTVIKGLVRVLKTYFITYIPHQRYNIKVTKMHCRYP